MRIQIITKLNQATSSILIFCLFFLLVPQAQAASLATLSDTMTRIQISTASNHTIVFTTPTGVAAAQTIIVTFPDGTANGFVGGSGIDYTDVDVVDDATDLTLGITGAGATWGAAFSGANLNTLTITSGTGTIAASSIITIRIGTNAVIGTTGDKQITNPNSSGSKTIAITGSFTDTGNIAVPIATTDQVVVSANIDPSITFTLSGTTAALGTMTTGAVAATTPITLTMGTNAGSGYGVTIQDEGSGASDGLYKSAAPTRLIDSNTADLTAGTEGYGARATTGTGSPTIVAPYNQAGTNPVGAMQRTGQSMITFAGPTGATNQTATLVFRAAISASTSAGSYADTATLIMTGNF